MLMALLILTSPEAYVNAGRDALAANQLPQAILIYRDGLQRFPTNRHLQQDLLAARGLVTRPTTLPMPPEFDDWEYHVDRNKQYGFWSMLACIMIVSFAWAYRKPTHRKYCAIIIAASILCFLFTCHHIAYIATQKPSKPGIVATASKLREGNGESYPVLYELPAGYEVEILHERGDWQRVNLSDGSMGWLRRDQLLTHD